MTTFKWSMLILILVVLLAAGLVGCGAQAGPVRPLSSPSPGGLTVVSQVTGEVLVMKAGTATWTKASAGMTLEPGDRIKTGAASNAVITFFEGSTIELAANTEISVTELGIAEDTGSTTIRLWEQIGKTRSRVKKLIDPASRYEIETPAGAAVVRGSVMDTRVAKDGTTTITTIEGGVWAVAQGREVKVPPHMMCTIVPGQIPSMPVPIPPPPVSPPPPSLQPPRPPSTAPAVGPRAGVPLPRPWRTWTQTTVNDFNAGTADSVIVIDIGGGDGTVVLASDPQVEFKDQNNPNYSDNMTHSVYGEQYQAQAFRAGMTGSLSKVALRLKKIGRPSQPLVVELRSCVATGNGIEPGNTVHASVVTDNISRAAEYPFSFAMPHTVVLGTHYCLVLYQQGNSGNATNCYNWYEDTDKYADGMVWQSQDGGSTWQKGAEGKHDFYFVTYVNGHYLSGTFESSSCHCRVSAEFGTIAWDNASSPGANELVFQIATNRNNRTWNFVGPDGTSGTYYHTSGTNIWSGHDGDRYIKYKAYLRTIDLSQTPELKEVRIAYR